MREASEEAHQRHIKIEEAKDAEEKEKDNFVFSNPVNECPFEADKSFWTPTSQIEKERMTTVANSIYKLAQKFQDNNDDVTPSMLILARDSLPAALKLLRMPDNWERVDDGKDAVVDNVTNTMTMLCSLAPKAEVRLCRDEISDIWAITNLLLVVDCDWWDDHWKELYEPLIAKCFLSEGITVLAEIAQQDCHLRGMLCFDFLSKIVMDNDWTEEDILRVCAAYTHVLCDKRTEGQTNAMVYAAIFDISNQLRWTQILCDNLLEPARKVDSDYNIDTDAYCELDFTLLLLRLSKALAKVKVRTAAGLTGEQLGRLDDDDKTGDIMRKLPTSEEWSFFLEVFKQNADGIIECDCAIEEPKLFW